MSNVESFTARLTFVLRGSEACGNGWGQLGTMKLVLNSIWDYYCIGKMSTPAYAVLGECHTFLLRHSGLDSKACASEAEWLKCWTRQL